MSLFDNEPDGPGFPPPTRSTKSLPHAVVPLAERMRPRTLDELCGQQHLIGPGKPLRVQIERDDASSMIFWGPPGVGKTTLAKIVADTTRANFIEFSAVVSGIKEIKQVMADAAKAAELHSRTILFIDEIHRFNKAQQDAFLPYVERGTIRLIGATTENPSFEIISALLSRCRVYVLEPLSNNCIEQLLRRALADSERGLGALNLTADDDALQMIAAYSSGDCRSAYNALEVAAQLAIASTNSGSPRGSEDMKGPGSAEGYGLQPVQDLKDSGEGYGLQPAQDLKDSGEGYGLQPVQDLKDSGEGYGLQPVQNEPGFSGASAPAGDSGALKGHDFSRATSKTEMPGASAPAGAPAQDQKKITKAIAAEALQKRVLMYDKQGEEHYNLISALHKSVRNSDPDAALYWLGRMFAGGEDPLYLARRIVRMAVEDIGLAAPEALNLCLSAKEAIDFLGSPEGDLALAEAVVYLCLAPKSNSVYTAYGAVQEDIERTRQEPVPLHLRNAPTKLMKDLGYSRGYKYAHDEEDKVAAMDCLPDSLRGRTYYQPTQEGREKQLAARMEEIRKIRAGKHRSI